MQARQTDKAMKTIEERKQEISEFIEEYVAKHKSKENLVNESDKLIEFYLKNAIELLGLDYVITKLNGKIFEKYKSTDRQLIANMTALANLIYVNTNLKNS